MKNPSLKNGFSFNRTLFQVFLVRLQMLLFPDQSGGSRRGSSVLLGSQSMEVLTSPTIWNFCGITAACSLFLGRTKMLRESKNIYSSNSSIHFYCYLNSLLFRVKSEWKKWKHHTTNQERILPFPLFYEKLVSF